MSDYDCIVVGSGHAGSCAALAAKEAGCRKVLMIDKCPATWVGGNGYFTAGAHRTVHAGLEDLLAIVKGVPIDKIAHIDMDPYTRDDFIEDVMRLSGGRSHAALLNAVVDNSRSAIDWLAKTVGVPFTFSFNRQAYEVNGKQKFWGGLVLSVEEGGKGLIAAHQAALARAGVEIWFDTACQEILLDEEEAIAGLLVRREGVDLTVRSPAVTLAAGGFEANPATRAQNLGPGWEKAKVRGTPFNTGEVILQAQRIGAELTGDWKGCHSTAWDANAADHCGHRVLTNQYTKSGYPLGVMVNAKGKRFVDEGEDFRNYTYAKFGRGILLQPGSYAFQIWDNKTIGSLRIEEYDESVVKRIMADSLPELAQRLSLHGLDHPDAFLATMDGYNLATMKFQQENPARTWDPSVKDGLTTQTQASSLAVPKSNWALPLSSPPFMAVKVACGITFTFGGLAIDADTAGVISERTGQTIKGLFCTGEMVGGLFYDNYPGGSGLTAGAVFGCTAGYNAALLSNHSH